MPSTVQDARDLLISSVLCPDPVIYIDDRWLYEQTGNLEPIKETPLNSIEPKCLKKGDQITIVGSGFSTHLAMKASNKLNSNGISTEVFDLRVLNPFNAKNILDSVVKTKRLLVIDSGWKTCGMASEVISSIVEQIPTNILIDPPRRITLPDSPAPSSEIHEKDYYPNEEKIIKFINEYYRFFDVKD
jgi:pyruvate dehydrogenase E1 component beta subunit